MTRARTKFLFIYTALATLALSACSTLSVTSDVNTRASIASCHTYAWTGETRGAGPGAPGERAQANPVNAQRLRDAIGTALQARGLLPAANRNTADCLVGFTVGVRQVVNGFAGPPYGGWGWGWGWGWRHGGAWMWDEPYVVEEGLIAIDIYQARDRQPIWHATVNQNITRLTGADAEARIQTAVDALFSRYPGGSVPAVAPAGGNARGAPAAAT